MTGIEFPAWLAVGYGLVVLGLLAIVVVILVAIIGATMSTVTPTSFS